MNLRFADTQYVFLAAQSKQKLPPFFLIANIYIPLKFLEAAPSISNFIGSSLSKFYKTSFERYSR
jgi:hypothetical protein